MNAVCQDNKDKTSCDAVADCTWCTSGAVKPQCNSIEDAKQLPPSIFACDKLTDFVDILKSKNVYPKDPAACATIKSSISCDSNSDCTWCAQKCKEGENCSGPQSCYSIADAQALTPGLFVCDKLPEEEVNAVCQDNKDKTSCDAVADCTWCTSGAVKPQCNSIEDAKQLPPSIFACDKLSTQFEHILKQRNYLPKKPFADKKKVDPKPKSEFEEFLKTLRGEVTATCQDNKDQKSCDAVADCTWCTSGAVKPQCNSIEDAKQLPPSIFACDKLQEEQSSAFGAMAKPHHKKHHCCGGVIFLFFAFIGYHIYILTQFSKAHKEASNAGVVFEKKEWKCKFSKRVCKQASAAQPVAQANHAINTSINSDDFPQVHAPARHSNYMM